MKFPPSLELNEQIPTSGASPESQAIATNRQAKLISAVERLPLSFRLGLTPNAVAIRMSRAKDLLRTLIGEQP